VAAYQYHQKEKTVRQFRLAFKEHKKIKAYVHLPLIPNGDILSFDRVSHVKLVTVASLVTQDMSLGLLRFFNTYRLQSRRALTQSRHLNLRNNEPLTFRSAFFAMSVSRNSSKRKIDEDDDLEDGPSSQMTETQESNQSQASQSSKAKKARTDATKNTPEYTNKVLPVKISFPPRIEGALRIAAWNICGLAASQKKACRMIYVARW